MGQGATDVERIFARARELCQRLGSPPQLCPALWGALALVHRTGERHGEADLYRLKGELLFALPAAHQAEAEACFRQAIAIARSQGAKSWELRAVLSLSRLYHQQGKAEDARPMLAESYGWFTEGFETADLQEAKALLEVIS